jgi:hypothetical protein
MEIIQNETDLEIEVRDICNAQSVEESDTEKSLLTEKTNTSSYENAFLAILNMILKAWFNQK